MRLRVSKPRIEFDDFDAVFRDNQSAIQQADEGNSAFRQLANGGKRDRVGHVLHEVVRQPAQWAVCAHSPGVGALITVEGSLVVLGWCERNNAGAVGEKEQRYFFTVEEFFHDDGAVLEVVAGVIDGSLPVLGDNDAFASSETIRFDDVGASQLIKSGVELIES